MSFSPCVLCTTLSQRDYREGWPLLTVETEVIGTQRVQLKRVLPWVVHWACRAVTRDFCSALAVLVGPVQNIFFLTVHYFNSFVPIAQQAGQAAVLGRLSLNMCLCSVLTLAVSFQCKILLGYITSCHAERYSVKKSSLLRLFTLLAAWRHFWRYRDTFDSTETLWSYGYTVLVIPSP